MRWTIAIILALFTSAIVSDTVAARPAKRGVQAAMCNCTCVSDEKGQGGFPRYTEAVSFAEQSETACHHISGFGGCRVKLSSGYAVGTLRGCKWSAGAAASTQNGGIDPGQPQTSSPFGKPKKLFSTKP